MRSAIFVTFAIVPAAPEGATPDQFADAAGHQQGTAASPSGEGNPGAIVCRAPQRLPGGASGPKVCMHNSVWAQLTLAGKNLAADGKTVIARAMVEDPQGLGDPDAATCRKPQEIPTGWHLKAFGPEVCLTSQYWARLKADRKIVPADGRGIVDTRLVSPPYPGPLGSFGTPATSALGSSVVH